MLATRCCRSLFISAFRLQYYAKLYWPRQPRSRTSHTWLLFALLIALCSPLLSHASPATVTFNGVTQAISTGAITLNNPAGAALSVSGDFYISDTANNQIVKVATDGTASVVDLSALSPALSGPVGITVDGSGNLYIADTGNSRIVKVDSSGTPSVVSTGSVTLNAPKGVAKDPSGNLYIIDTGNNQLVKVPASGSPAIVTLTGAGASLSNPSGIAADQSGKLFIADTGNNRIITVASGTTVGNALSITGLGTAISGPTGVAADNLGGLQIADTGNNRIVKVTAAGAGTALTTGSFSLSGSQGIALDLSSTSYVADTANSRVLKIESSTVDLGKVSLGAGSGNSKTLSFTVPSGLTVGSIQYMTDSSQNIDFTAGTTDTCTGATNTTCTVDVSFLPLSPGWRKGYVVIYDNGGTPAVIGRVPVFGYSSAAVIAIEPGTPSQISSGATTISSPFQAIKDNAGNYYVTAYSGNKVYKIPSGGGSATQVTTTGITLSSVTGLAMDSTGNMFIADYGNNRIIAVTPAGQATTMSITGLPSAISLPTTLILDQAGNLIVDDYGNGRIVKVSNIQVSSGSSSGVGNVLSVTGYTLGSVSSTGHAVDAWGNVYIANYSSNRILKVDRFGNASQLATPGYTLRNPYGVAVDFAGNVYAIDSGNRRILRITPTGTASVVTLPGYTFSSFFYSLTVLPNGDLLIPDFGNNRIELLSVSTPSTLTFPNTYVYATSSALTATVMNLGDLNLLMGAAPVYPSEFPEDTSTANRCNGSSSLAQYSTCVIAADFNPQAVGTRSGNIVLNDNTLNVSSTTQNVPVTGTGVGVPVVSFSPTSLDFGTQLYGTSSSAQAVTLTNTGTAALSITSIATGTGYSQTNNCGSSLAISAQCTINVTFTPPTVGAVNANLTLTSNAPTSPNTVALTGTGITPAVTLSSSSLSFGNQLINTTSSPQTVTLTNSGTATLNISSIAVSGADFAQTNDCTSTLAVSAQCTISVTFDPTTTGSASGTVIITTDASTSPDSVTLDGTGIAPAVSLSTASLDFGTQLTGTTSSAQTVTLTNSGAATLNIASITTSGTFSQSNGCSTSLAPATTCTISVSFTPTSNGSTSGSLTITTDAATSPDIVTLTGTGIAPAVSLSTASLDFGTQLTGTTSSAQTVTLTNSGAATLNIASIATSGMFSQSNDCSTSLAPAAMCTISVSFTPTSNGSTSGSLTITTDATTSPDIVTLTGTGIAPAVTLSPTSLTFSATLGTTSATQTVTLTNGGAATLNISSISNTGAFSQSNTCGTSLAASASCSIMVSFSPTVLGAATGTLSVTSDASTSPDTVALNGTGTPVPTPAVGLSSTSVDFGNVVVNHTSDPHTVTLTNTGDANLSLSAITASTSFSVSHNCASTLSPSASCTITLTVTPTVVGDVSGTLTITSNAASSPDSVTLDVTSLSGELPPVSVHGGGAIGEGMLSILGLLALLRRRRTTLRPTSHLPPSSRSNHGYRRALIIVAITLSSLLALNSPARADDDWLDPSHFYLGTQLGASLYSLNSTKLSEGLQADGYQVQAQVASSGFGMQVYGGYQCKAGVGLQLAYTRIGSQRASITGTAPSDVNALLHDAADRMKGYGDMLDLDLRYKINVAPNIDIIPKAGYLYWTSQATVAIGSTAQTYSYSGSGYNAGLTLSYRITPQFSAGVGYDYMRMTSSNHAGQAFASFEWHFAQ